MFVDLARQWSKWVWGWFLQKYIIFNTDTPDLWLDIPQQDVGASRGTNAGFGRDTEVCDTTCY